MTARPTLNPATPVERARRARRIIANVAKSLSCGGDTALKQDIITAYCDGRIDQETAMRLIREWGLKSA